MLLVADQPDLIRPFAEQGNTCAYAWRPPYERSRLLWYLEAKGEPKRTQRSLRGSSLRHICFMTVHAAWDMEMETGALQQSGV